MRVCSFLCSDSLLYTSFFFFLFYMVFIHLIVHVLYCHNFYSSGPLVDSLARDRIFFVGTIKKNTKEFPAMLKNAKPPKGSYLSETVEGKSYFVFHDRREDCFVTNIFPERMDTPVARLQPEGVLRYYSVPSLLPAYNKFMGGVDGTDQLRKASSFLSIPNVRV